MKKFLCLNLIFLLLFLPFYEVSASEINGFEVTLTYSGREVMRERFCVNPEFLSIAKGREKEIIQNLKNGFTDTELLNYLFYDLGDKVLAVFDKIEKVLEIDCIELKNGSFGEFEYFPERSGIKVVKDDFFEKIVENFGKNVVYDIKTVKTEPKFTKNQLLSCTEKISEFSTAFANSLEGRRKNILLATKKINGYLLRSGEVFSFNEVVGKRTVENGFSDAKIILDGEYVDGVGGGVCQVATTLYNAVLRANLSVLEYHQHTLAPSYVPLSFDAMVSEWSDLKIKNTSENPVFICAKCEGGRVVVGIFGVSDGVELEFESEVSEVVRHKDWTEDSTNYKNGYKSQGYKIVKRDGKVISRTIFRRDYYKPYEIKQNST